MRFFYFILKFKTFTNTSINFLKFNTFLLFRMTIKLIKKAITLTNGIANTTATTIKSKTVILRSKINDVKRNTPAIK